MFLSGFFYCCLVHIWKKKKKFFPPLIYAIVIVVNVCFFLSLISLLALLPPLKTLRIRILHSHWYTHKITFCWCYVNAMIIKKELVKYSNTLVPILYLLFLQPTPAKVVWFHRNYFSSTLHREQSRPRVRMHVSFYFCLMPLGMVD